METTEIAADCGQLVVGRYVEAVRCRMSKQCGADYPTCMAGRVLEYPPEEDPTDMPISIEFADESITKAEAAGFSFMHGFRYGAGQATIPFSVPFGVTQGSALLYAVQGR